jgi:predicted P-loop ATPase
MNNTADERRAAMLFFESVSGLDHSFHIRSEATQDHYRHIVEDLDRLTAMFTYADEQQDAAVKKEEKKQKRIQQMELAFSIITAVFQLFTTAANILNYRPGTLTAMFNKFPRAQSLANKWQRGLSAMSNKFPNASRLAKFASRRKPGDGLLREKSIENSQSKF